MLAITLCKLVSLSHASTSVVQLETLCVCLALLLCRTGLIFKVTKNISETTCGDPQRDRTKSVSVTGLVGITLAMLVFLLRIIARTRNRQFGMDDWTMVMAMVQKDTDM